MCHKAGGLSGRAVLPEGDEVKMTAGQQRTQIRGAAGQTVVRGNGQQHGAAVAQMRLAGKADGRVGDAVCKLAERVARAGRDDQQIEQALRAERLDLRQRVQRFRAAQRRDLRPEIRRCAEAGVRLPRGVRKNGDDRILRCQGAQGVNGLSECAERAAQGKAYRRSQAGNAPSCSRIAAA